MAIEELQTGNICIGIKQTSKAILKGQAKKVFIAEDAQTFVVRSLIQSAKENNIPIEDVSSMEELGRVCNIDIGAAAAALLK